MAQRHQWTRRTRFTLDLWNMSALAWTLRNWRDESWPLFATTNSTSSHTPKGGALSKNGLVRFLPRSTEQRFLGCEIAADGFALTQRSSQKRRRVCVDLILTSAGSVRNRFFKQRKNRHHFIGIANIE